MNSLSKILYKGSSCVLLRGDNSFINYKQGKELNLPGRFNVVYKITDFEHEENLTKGQMIKNEIGLLKEIIDLSKSKTVVLAYETENNITMINEGLLTCFEEKENLLTCRISFSAELDEKEIKMGIFIYHEMSMLGKFPMLFFFDILTKTGYLEKFTEKLLIPLIVREF